MSGFSTGTHSVDDASSVDILRGQRIWQTSAHQGLRATGPSSAQPRGPACLPAASPGARTLSPFSIWYTRNWIRSSPSFSCFMSLPRSVPMNGITR